MSATTDHLPRYLTPAFKAIPGRRLGRIAPKARPQALRLANYVDASAAPPKPAVDYYTKAMAALRQMDLNDQLGCCVISSKAHHVGVWSGNDTDAPKLVLATDQEILSAYNRLKAGPGDSGCVISDVLDAFKVGIQFGGKLRKIDGYVAVDNANPTLVKLALDLFGGLCIGINLPNAWYQSQDGAVWDVTNSQIVGGHDVCCVGYDDTGVVVSTWGGLRTITWRAFAASNWVTECYALLGQDWYNADDLAPSGVKVEELLADLQKIGGGQLPPLPDPNPPAPVPPTPPTPTPPTPDPVPVPYDVAGTVTLKMGGLFGGTATGTFTGKAVPSEKVFHLTACEPDPVEVVGDLPDLPIVADLLQLIDDVKAGNFWAVLADLRKIESDPGFQAAGAILSVIVADVRAGKSLPQIVADVLALLPQAPAKPIAA